MKTYIKSTNTWPDGIPSDGEEYQKILESGGTQQQAYKTPTPEPQKYSTTNGSVSVGGVAQGDSPVYFGGQGDAVDMSFDVVDDQNAIQTQLDAIALGYPPVLALPVLKVANGSTAAIVDEIYFSTTLVAGVISVSGSFPASGNWQLLTERVNAALAEIGADWGLEVNNKTFRINS